MNFFDKKNRQKIFHSKKIKSQKVIGKTITLFFLNFSIFIRDKKNISRLKFSKENVFNLFLKYFLKKYFLQLFEENDKNPEIRD